MNVFPVRQLPLKWCASQVVSLISVAPLLKLIREMALAHHSQLLSTAYHVKHHSVPITIYESQYYDVDDSNDDFWHCSLRCHSPLMIYHHHIPPMLNPQIDTRWWPHGSTIDPDGLPWDGDGDHNGPELSQSRVPVWMSDGCVGRPCRPDESNDQIVSRYQWRIPTNQ